MGPQRFPERQTHRLPLEGAKLTLALVPGGGKSLLPPQAACWQKGTRGLGWVGSGGGRYGSGSKGLEFKPWNPQ